MGDRRSRWLALRFALSFGNRNPLRVWRWYRWARRPLGPIRVVRLSDIVDTTRALFSNPPGPEVRSRSDVLNGLNHEGK